MRGNAFAAGVAHHEAASAVGSLGAPWSRAGLSDKGRLLISGDGEDWQGRAEKGTWGGAEVID